MLEQFKQMLGLIRFSHTIFALPFAILAAIMAWHQSAADWMKIGRDLCGILACMVFARSAAMAFNRLVDRHIDAQNPRTANRHLPAGILSVKSVWLFTLFCSAGFILSTLIFLPNYWPLALSVPVLLFLLGYSYTKRFTFLCHYWLAAALMLSPVAAWLAITAELSLAPLFLGLSVFFWVGGFDILYACQDQEFDQDSGLRSIPARFGIPRSLKLAAFSHFLMLLCLVGLWHFSELQSIFIIGIIPIAILLVYEHRIVDPNNLSRVNIAFFNINAVISVGLLLLVALDLMFQ